MKKENKLEWFKNFAEKHPVLSTVLVIMGFKTFAPIIRRFINKLMNDD
ncbi:hypothetical protein LCGC14_2297560 [marine sediment metagenome]|uniref:Uncharacterized protein n=1 Tax=marine sediment metagenome TaxID=412755 RepID=A0A0F9CPC9_9ZZZZ